jgi:hypothetical protein
MLPMQQGTGVSGVSVKKTQREYRSRKDALFGASVKAGIAGRPMLIRRLVPKAAIVHSQNSCVESCGCDRLQPSSVRLTDFA